MALVRCPIHKIPYNDENPRGCPACAREKLGGGDQAELMRELARMSQSVQQPPEATAPAAPPGGRPSVTPQPAVPAATRPVTTPPKVPVPSEGWLAKLGRAAAQRRVISVGIAVSIFAAIVLVATSGPEFVEGADPPLLGGSDARPLPLDPATSITTVFAVLGTQVPRAVENAPRLARYGYGTGLSVDALNRVVYAVTLEVPSWSWHGLRVGQEERTARGQLALLGPVFDAEAGPQPAPRLVGRYLTFPSLAQRPRRTLSIEVRPPNGCFDVLVDLQPRAAGVLVHRNSRFAVIGEGEAPLEWVATRIRVVDRSVVGPYADGPPAC